MKIVFIGTVTLSERILKKLLDMGANIVGVCTKEKSAFNADFSDLTLLCKENSLPCKCIEDVNSEDSINWIQSLEPDVIFCFGWSSLIKSELLQLAPHGVIGYHPARLPENRGRHPIIWAISLGLKRSASTFFFMDEGADSGDILSQVDFDILDEDNATTVYEKVIKIAVEQIAILVPQLEGSNYKRIKQNNKIANIWRKRSKSDGQIDFRMTSVAIDRLVRALTKPYVGAHIEYQGKDIVVWDVEICSFDRGNIEPGTVLDIDANTVLVKTYDGAIRLLDHEFVMPPIKGDYL